MPAFDRDSGSQDIDYTVQFLLRAGWHVTYIAREERGIAEERHANRLRQMGVATYAGLGVAERVLRSSEFDLAIIAFWELAAELLPLLRKQSPNTRVVINTIDVHFLRNARRSFGQGGQLGASFGAETARELNTYGAVDAVIAVSDKERDLLSDLIGRDHAFTVPLAENIQRSAQPLDRRQGMYFVGNFRHLPNREAVEYVCAEVLPLLDPELLVRHPFTVLGNWLDQVTLDIDPATPGVRLVGWVPVVQPYIERSRLGVVPLLHGAGVKRKVIQSMMAGTPVVTTPVGAEGLELVQGRHALIAADAADFAAGVSRLLTDDALWHRIAHDGAAHVERRHGLDLVERHFNDVINTVMTRSRRAHLSGYDRAPGFSRDDGDVSEVIRRRLQTIVRPGDVVLVATTADNNLAALGSSRWWPFPQNREGEAVSYEPVDGDAAVNHLEAQRARGARFFALPKAFFGWRRRYPELFRLLETAYRRIHQDEYLAVYEIGESAVQTAVLDPTPAVAVHVVGTYAADRTGPAPAMLAELTSSTYLTVTQEWWPASVDREQHATEQPDAARYVVFVRDDALLPVGFLDTLIATHATLGVERVQPAHNAGPSGGPPITERHIGVIGREVDEVTSLPVLSVRAGATRHGPVTVADNVSVGLRHSLDPAAAGNGFVRRVWIANEAKRPTVFVRPEPSAPPRISVLIATYDRHDLLRSCLAAFAAQTLDRSDYEVVVVDDGSATNELARVLEEAPAGMQVVGLRIEHGGRSAAKNHAVFLARAPIVLFFDDDDRPAPDYLERHLAAHDANPAERTAILGHTDWAPELERTPLMHYVTDIDRLMFAYQRLGHGQQLDWRGFWEGRISCKRAFLLRHGLHDQRLGYSIDIEMGWRLAPAGLRIVYDSTAKSFMARGIDFVAFCERTEAKGRAHATIAILHAGTDIAKRLGVEDAASRWEQKRRTEHELRQRVATLEARARTGATSLDALYAAYREIFQLLHAKGAAGASEGGAEVSAPPATVQPFASTDPALVYDDTPSHWRVEPSLSVTIPVWSRTPELAEMARRTIDRVWQVARVPTEVVVVDNGSPCEIRLPAKVYRYAENRGVSVGWNTGIRLSSAPLVVVLNSDCMVEPGWDEALCEAGGDGRRIAFPYTDHCDGLGFVQPDQGGTAGWCFLLSKAVYEEVGPFDEWFSPAFCEDTDYWHRAWQLGIELSPVPAARVVHARRTSSQARADLLLQAHRLKYGWKHNVDPNRAPPYYNREIVEYVGSCPIPDRASARRANRARVFGIGLNKTGTTSLHEALTMLGFTSLHWGGPSVRRIIEVSLAAGEPLLSRINPYFDAFTDVLPLTQNFQLLDEQYPGSRFILTTRPLDAWIESRCRHVASNVRRHAAGEYRGAFLEVDEATWRAEWEAHVERARDYFAGRDDFLEIDITARGEWLPLCRFLGVAEPSRPFPWVNRSPNDVDTG
jgi:GT2 family glycosyltransferase/glycosyltransferase involved in cell wall biosynthesis